MLQVRLTKLTCGLHFTNGVQDGKWAAEKVIEVPGKKVDNWALPTMPGLFMCYKFYLRIKDLKSTHKACGCTYFRFSMLVAFLWQVNSMMTWPLRFWEHIPSVQPYNVIIFGPTTLTRLMLIQKHIVSLSLSLCSSRKFLMRALLFNYSK